MAWIAAEASELPLFPIGGIGLENASELERIGRVAVSSANLTVANPAEAARTLRALLEP
jgi:thiamine monophosphate synthase